MPVRSGGGELLGSEPRFPTPHLSPQTSTPVPFLPLPWIKHKAPARPHGEAPVPKEAWEHCRCSTGEKSSLTYIGGLKFPVSCPLPPPLRREGWDPHFPNCSGRRSTQSLPGNTLQCPPSFLLGLNLLKCRGKGKQNRAPGHAPSTHLHPQGGLFP